MRNSHVIFGAGAVASWLVCSTPYRAVWVRALTGDIVLCACARHFNLTVSTQEYKSERRNLMLREVDIFQVPSCHKNRDKLRPDRPLGSYADFTYHDLWGIILQSSGKNGGANDQ